MIGMYKRAVAAECYIFADFTHSASPGGPSKTSCDSLTVHFGTYAHTKMIFNNYR